VGSEGFEAVVIFVPERYVAFIQFERFKIILHLTYQ